MTKERLDHLTSVAELRLQRIEIEAKRLPLVLREASEIRDIISAIKKEISVDPAP